MARAEPEHFKRKLLCERGRPRQPCSDYLHLGLHHYPPRDAACRSNLGVAGARMTTAVGRWPGQANLLLRCGPCRRHRATEVLGGQGRALRPAAARPSRLPRCSLANRMAIEPSPTAEATRLTDPLRASPAASTPGRLASSK